MAAHSEQSCERFRRLNYGQLQIDLTVDDPKALKPWTVRCSESV
jgi:hypothetical protein